MGVDAIEEPQPLLAGPDRQRAAVGEHPHRRRRRTWRCRAPRRNGLRGVGVDTFRLRRQCRCGEDIAQRPTHAEALADGAQQLGRQQRLSAKLEKTRIGANGVDAENAAPQLGQLDFGDGARGAERELVFGQQCERRPIQVAVLVDWQGLGLCGRDPHLRAETVVCPDAVGGQRLGRRVAFEEDLDAHFEIEPRAVPGDEGAPRIQSDDNLAWRL